MKSYIRAVKRTVHDNGPAFGYSISITGTIAALSALKGSPTAWDIMFAVLSVAAAFSLMEIVSTYVLHGSDENRSVVQLGNTLNFLSIGLSVASVLAIIPFAPKTAAWALSPFVAAIVYVLVTAFQLTMVRKITK